MTGKISGIFCSAVVAGVLVAPSPAMLAQMRGGGMGAPPPQPGMQQNTQPGMPNNGMPNQAMGTQNNPEAIFVGHIRRNSKVETDLSKLALKNSSNDAVKKMAQQVVSEDRQNGIQLTGATASNPALQDLTFGEQTPSESRQAEKQMKKLTGIPFDQMYLSQMDAYVKDDQKTINEASSLSSSNMGPVLMQMRNTSDDRAKQIAAIAQSENFKIR